MVTEWPFISHEDGKMYAKNSTDGYISKWPDGFNGYLAYSSTTHHFANYPNKNDTNHKSLFWQEIWAHIFFTKRRKSDLISKAIFQVSTRSFTFNNSTSTQLINTDKAALKIPTRFSSPDENKCLRFCYFY